MFCPLLAESRYRRQRGTFIISVAETKQVDRILEVLSFLRSGEGLIKPLMIITLTFQMKKGKMKLCGLLVNHVFFS